MATRLLQHASLPEILTDALSQKYELVDYFDLTSDQLTQNAEEFTVLLTNGEDTVGRDLIESLPNLELIADFGVGYDGIDLEAAREHHVAVSNTPGVLTADVADLVIALILSVARQVPAAEQFITQGDWTRGSYPWTTKVSGSRLGIVGLGRIGSAVAHRAAAFDMEISYTDRGPIQGARYTFVDGIHELARNSDFLVVCAPGGNATKNLVDASVLEALGKSGYLVNIARGTVVDEDALIRAITEGTIAGAALDVFAHEPKVPAELLGLPNVVVTPHLASATWQTRREMARLVEENVNSWLDRHELVTPVRP